MSRRSVKSMTSSFDQSFSGKMRSAESANIAQFCDLSRYHQKLESMGHLSPLMRGYVREITGLVVKARLPEGKIGDVCSVRYAPQEQVLAEVIGFRDEDVFLTPYDNLYAVGLHSPVENRSTSLHIPVGYELLGRVIDSLGNPLDKKGPLGCSAVYPIRQSAPPSMERQRISKTLPVGVKAIDGLLTIGEGQRVGVFSVAGVGKSSLLGMIARNSKADVNVVALVGERGREVIDFLEDNLGSGLSRSVVVVSTSDEAPLRRVVAAYSATAIAEYFRDQGLRVMLLMDSVTRFARALREIALSLGELPIRSGYPPSVFSVLPQLFERAGFNDKGSITALYTILLATEQVEDPLGEEIRAILDGHLMLSSRLSQSQHFPAIDILASNSRLMDVVASPEHRLYAEKIKRMWAVYEENRDLISIGAYKRGTDSTVDEALSKREVIAGFLRQSKDQTSDFSDTIEQARKVSGVP